MSGQYEDSCQVNTRIHVRSIRGFMSGQYKDSCQVNTRIHVRSIRGFMSGQYEDSLTSEKPPQNW